MDISIAARIAELHVRNREPVLLVGAPGIGKSDLVDQIGASTGFDLMVSHPVTADPTDAKGLPFVAKEGVYADFLPYGDLYRAMTATKPLIWMLDDLGQASAAVQASYMQLLLARSINGHKLSEHVRFIAATNRKRDRAGVSGILEPVKDRMAGIIEVTTSVPAWTKWALNNNVPVEFIAFLRFKNEFLKNDTPESEIVASYSPRSWGKLAKTWNLGIPADLLADVVECGIGPVAGKEFMEFLTVWREMPSPETVLLTPQNVAIPKKLSTLYALVSSLATKATPQNFNQLVVFATRLNDEGHGEIASLMLNDSVQRKPDLASTAAYATAITGPLKDLMG